MGGPNWSTANGQSIGWAQVDESEVLAGIKAGLDAGVNHWDNADIYGNGRAERLLGWAFRKLGVKRETQVIATKVGHFKGTAPHGYDADHIRNQFRQSLRNLGTDYIDIYYFHHGTYVGPGYETETHDYLPEAAAVMHDLVKQGKVRLIGQSAYSDDDFARAIPVLRPHVLQNKANLRYADFIRPGSRLQGMMKEYNCSFVAFGPLDQGILLDKFDPHKPPQFEPGDYRTSRKDFTPETLMLVREKLGKVASRFGAAGRPTIETLSSVAQRWVLSHEHVCSTIPGFRNVNQAVCNVAAAKDEPMSAADAEWLRTLFGA